MSKTFVKGQRVRLLPGAVTFGLYKPGEEGVIARVADEFPPKGDVPGHIVHVDNVPESEQGGVLTLFYADELEAVA